MVLLGLPAQTYMCSRKANPAGRLLGNNQDDTQTEPPILQIVTSHLPTTLSHTKMLRCLSQVFQQHAAGTSCHGLLNVVKCYHNGLRVCSFFFFCLFVFCFFLKIDEGRKKGMKEGKQGGRSAKMLATFLVE